MKKLFLFFLISLFYFQNVSAQKDSVLLAQTPDSSLKVFKFKTGENQESFVFFLTKANGALIRVVETPVLGGEIIDTLGLELSKNRSPVMIYFGRHRRQDNGPLERWYLEAYDILNKHWLYLVR